MKVHFEPLGVSLDCKPGTLILEAARKASIPLQAVCGGRGRCGKCKTRIVAGAVPETDLREENLLSPEALSQGYRLACLHGVDKDDMTVEFLPFFSYPGRKSHRKLRSFKSEPVICHSELKLSPPTLQRAVDDTSNLLETLNQTTATNYTHVDSQVLRSLPKTIREGNWQITVSGRESEVIAVRPRQHTVRPMGIAIDLGTTNIAVYLYHLDDGSEISALSGANPLMAYGADILTRLSYSQRNQEFATQLQQSLIKTINFNY